MIPKKHIIVIGGGAAGFFGAISAATHFPDAQVTILEKNRTVLNKVRISGGGRCNVTHACFDDKALSKFYPRGGSFLRPLFKQFNANDTVEWFEKQGVKLKTEADGRMFPITDSSETIIDCLLKNIRQKHILVKTSEGVKAIQPPKKNGFWEIELLSGAKIEADAILITSGGNPQTTGYQWLADLGLKIIEPVPSLFTFNVPNSPFLSLSGVAVPQASVRIAGKKLMQTGALLVTHWGFSGPAVLKLSAWAARELAEMNYQFTLLINWLGEVTETQLRENLAEYKKQNPKKQIASNALFNLPSRLWKMLTQLSEVGEELRWIDISPKQLNKLVENLINCPQQVNGKSTFKEEFVTAGGIDLAEINPETMESKQHKGLFFAGEVLDIDAVTGGFNFQAAWTTAFVAGKNMLV
jgi:predicted Rossmann fold flavoprotein